MCSAIVPYFQTIESCSVQPGSVCVGRHIHAFSTFGAFLDILTHIALSFSW